MTGSPFYTPAIGIRFPAWIRLLKENTDQRIRARYWPRVVGTGLIALASWPFQRFEDIRLRARIKSLELDDEPVFIIGHWRSGTTHLHTLLGCDRQFGHVTTLQGVFPHSFQTNFLFPKLLSWLIPPTRPMDDIKIHPYSPQEEEIALMAYGSSSLYSMWLFPDQARNFYRRFVEFEGMDASALDDWKGKYLNLLKKAALFSGKRRLLLKNPPNTGRIPTLLKLFPNARFVYLFRDPMGVYASTKKLHSRVWPLYNLQDVDVERLNSDIVYIYKRMTKKFLRDKSLIPAGQLVEVAYSDLVTRPMHVLEWIYGELGLDWSDRLASIFETHLDEQETRKESEYLFSTEERAMLNRELKFAIDLWSKDGIATVEALAVPEE